MMLLDKLQKKEASGLHYGSYPPAPWVWKLWTKKHNVSSQTRAAKSFNLNRRLNRTTD
jgi:hypothetical protein